jgi:hypothetical protein
MTYVRFEGDPREYPLAMHDSTLKARRAYEIRKELLDKIRVPASPRSVIDVTACLR